MLKKSVIFLQLSFLIAVNIGCSSYSSPEYTNIKPSDENIRYTGRIDFSDPDSPVIYCPGTSISANFNGSSLKIAMEDSLGGGHYNIIIDGRDDDPFILFCKPGDTVYSIVTGLENTTHSVQVFRRTEAVYGPTRFRGFILDPGKSLGDMPVQKKRLIEFYGNSITCGMGNEAPVDGRDNKTEEENNYLAYGAITARNLDAEYVCIAKSGIGIMISWFDFVMPDYYNRLHPLNPASRWDFSKWTPDAVIVNLFQNDSWLMDRLDPIPDDVDRINAYTGFIRTLRTEYPDTPIVCVLGTMDAIKPGSVWPGYIELAVEKMREQYNDKNVFSYIFEYQNFDKHPRVRHHMKMADELTKFIKNNISWN